MKRPTTQHAKLKLICTKF